MRISHISISILLVTLGASASGCVVGQPAGKGQLLFRTEARTGVGYYLYLPEDYVATEGTRDQGRKWPMVVSFHGMRPFDSAGGQAMEWQQEADRYGYVVVVPDTRVSDLLGEIPIRRVSSSLKFDENATLAILDEVYQLADVDPNHVLSTSWSMGGYIAHYIVNRHPDRFSCIAVRQSNFSSDILDVNQVPTYKNTKIGIFYTQNDFDICRRESQDAIAWYNKHGFEVTAGIVERLGHERTPETAAAFFASTCGATPKTPPTQLARLTLKPPPVRHETTLMSASDSTRVTKPNDSKPIETLPQRNDSKPEIKDKETIASRNWQSTTPNPPRTTMSQNHENTLTSSSTYPVSRHESQSRAFRKNEFTPTDSHAPDQNAQRKTYTTRTTPDDELHLHRRVRSETLRPDKRKPAIEADTRFERQSDSEAATNATYNPIKVVLSAYIAISPTLLSYSVQMPHDMREDATITWLDNGSPISTGISGQKSLVEPGQHKIEVVVLTRQDQEHRAYKTVTVLEPLRTESQEEE